MANYFPHVTGAFRLEEPRALQRFSRSIFGMAAVTGVGLRMLRSLTLLQGPNESLLVVGALVAFGLVLLCGMTALHLGNYTLHRWVWRAPAFAASEATVEAATSLLRIALKREPVGSSLATWSDWPELAIRAYFWRLTSVILFALVLAGVVQVVRYTLLKREHRDHTLERVHHELEVEDTHRNAGS